MGTRDWGMKRRPLAKAFIGYSSRKGRKGAKDAKGRVRREGRGDESCI
jgi:hypothetical protein